MSKSNGRAESRSDNRVLTIHPVRDWTIRECEIFVGRHSGEKVIMLQFNEINLLLQFASPAELVDFGKNCAKIGRSLL